MQILAEIRLPEAIDRKLLSPFQYFGVTDTVDLDSLKWTRGGYDKTESVEGDDIYLEYTTAKVVRGNTVRLGAGCKIDLVEYKTSLEKASDCIVKEEKHGSYVDLSK